MQTWTPTGATAPLLKRLNEQTVLETIRAGAPISRAEISRRAGISKPTVSLALRSLLEAGLVRKADAPSGPSYGAVYFEPVAEAALILGIDLGARFVRGAVCDLSGQTRARQDVELASVDVDVALRTIAELHDALIESTGLDGDLIDGVVVGVPGVVEASGRLALAENVPGLEDRAFGEELGARLDLPVVLENDINLAALGEQWLGVAQGIDDFVFLSVGTGMGAGLVLGGNLHRGHHGAAGEVDYALVGLGIEVDPSAVTLQELTARLAAESQAPTSLRPPYDGRAVFAAARGGDALARAAVEEVARRIALHAAAISAVSDVALAVLGGGLGVNGDLLLEPVRSHLAAWLPYPPQVEVSSLGEAAILSGALAVGLRSALENVFKRRAAPVPA